MSSHAKILSGINEIKQMLKRKDENAARVCVLTTGPVIRCDGVNVLYVEVLNNLENPQTVRILLFDLGQWPKQVVDHRVKILNSNCAISEGFEIGPGGLDLLKFEVQIELLGGVHHGVYIFVAGTLDDGFTLAQSNVFRHEQLSLFTEND